MLISQIVSFSLVLQKVFITLLFRYAPIEIFLKNCKYLQAFYHNMYFGQASPVRIIIVSSITLLRLNMLSYFVASCCSIQKLGLNPDTLITTSMIDDTGFVQIRVHYILCNH